ncbi:MAG TPA: CHAD domain-containing protein [Vicinamibacterales bacterium]|nr:CHAD domain-containing protein [Vicinamibacterales bacterium]
MPHATTQVVKVLCRVLRENAAALARDLSHARRGDVAAVHHVRVATRRLRAALPLATEMGGFGARDLARDLKHVTRAFGEVREADVVRELVLDLAERQDWPPLAVTRIERLCLARRHDQRDAMRRELSGVRARSLEKRVEDVAARLESADPQARALAVILAEVRERTRKLSARLEAAGTVYGVEPLHRVRIAAKKLRYALEAVQGTLDRADDRARRRLKRFQEHLGRIHDLQVTQQYIRGTQSEPDVTPAVAAQLAGIDQAIDLECRQLHGQLLRERAAIVTMLDDLTSAIASRVTPRRVGRMARMRNRRPGRRVAMGA